MGGYGGEPGHICLTISFCSGSSITSYSPTCGAAPTNCEHQQCWGTNRAPLNPAASSHATCKERHGPTGRATPKGRRDTMVCCPQGLCQHHSTAVVPAPLPPLPVPCTHHVWVIQPPHDRQLAVQIREWRRTGFTHPPFRQALRERGRDALLSQLLPSSRSALLCCAVLCWRWRWQWRGWRWRWRSHTCRS